MNVSLIRDAFVGLYPLDESPAGLAALASALSHPSKYVLKPQREGGGNNFYHEQVKTQLETLSPAERNAYILMDLINPPKFKNAMMREGEVLVADVVSEMGVYGTWISDGTLVHLNQAAGHLLRTKRYLNSLI